MYQNAFVSNNDVALNADKNAKCQEICELKCRKNYKNIQECRNGSPGWKNLTIEGLNRFN